MSTGEHKVVAVVKVDHTSHGAIIQSTEDQILLGLVPVEGTPAIVGLSLGDTVNMGNYNGVRAQVSLSLPVPANDAAVEAGFERTHSWVERKLAAVIARGMKAHPNANASANPNSDFDYR